MKRLIRDFGIHGTVLCAGTLLLPCLAVAAPSQATAVTPSFIHSFSNQPDGANPFGGLTLGPDGALYGTTQWGGIYGPDDMDGNPGNGTLFRIGADHRYSVLYSFTHVDDNIANDDGRSPMAPLSVAPDGTLYGIAAYGGHYDSGVAFRYSMDTGFTALHYFGATQPDPLGQDPVGGLTLGPDGMLFGATSAGGADSPADGIVFRLAADGSQLQALQSFGGPDIGMRPASALLLASDGQLYGIATQVTSTSGGALYRIAQDGSGFVLLHQFNLSTEGGFNNVGIAPSVVEGSDGNLYGATSRGASGTGVLFRVAKDGSGFTILHRFAKLGAGNVNSGGGNVQTTLVLGRHGLLYGTTRDGGHSGKGIVFRIAPDGSDFTVLYNFRSTGSDGSNATGANPVGNITFDGNGDLCGTADFGGRHALGTAWCLKIN